jgi:probable biosynthetic protein (TIGR04098 family)
MSKIKLGMPHLSYNGIDPVWLFKELGGNHWDLLSESVSFYNESQRLYASFFGVELDFNKGQDHFKENDQLSIKSKIFKFNSQIYRSIHSISVDNNSAIARLDSIFVKKDIVSGSLIRDEPSQIHKNIDSIDHTFLEEHKQIKKKLSGFDKDNFNLLPFSPESYFNGVKILYCANYLNLVLLNEYLTFKKIQQPIKKINLYFFKNIAETDQVFGSTTQINNIYETILVANNKPIGFCKIER